MNSAHFPFCFTLPRTAARKPGEYLAIAAARGELEEVKVLCSDPEIDVNNTGGVCPLILSCGHGHLDVADYLLQNPKVDPNFTEGDRATALWLACQEGQFRIVELLMADVRIDVNKVDHDTVSPFFIACQNGRRDIVAKMLADPRIDVRKARADGSHPLYSACQEGRRDIVTTLLADARFEVNRKTGQGTSPFWIACQWGSLEVVDVLLDDMRVDVNSLFRGSSVLFIVVQLGLLEVLQLLLASGREINTKLRDSTRKTAAEEARNWKFTGQVHAETPEELTRIIQNGPGIVDLLDSFEVNRDAMRQSLRRLPNIRGFFVNRVFALVVFTTDGFLAVGDAASPEVRRFFSIVEKFPIELQMVICYRLFGSPKNTVSSRDSEPAFLWLARKTTWTGAR